MVKVTVAMVRGRAEHNDGHLASLEELSLHQLDVTDLCQLPVWCPRLKILLLQGNLLSQLGKIGRLRELEYLNLALNCLEELPASIGQCECLSKLDLISNFITDLEHTVAVLQDLPHLTELYLMGNPVSSYDGYRSFTIASLPGLCELDGVNILRHERIRALQEATRSRGSVLAAQREAQSQREAQKAAQQNQNVNASPASDDSEDDAEFGERWRTELSDHSPEARLAMHEELRRRRLQQQRQSEPEKPKKEVRLYTKDGRPLNVNQAKIDFKFTENEDNNTFELEVHAYKHLDPSLLQCSVEPQLVRVTILGKVLQLVLPEEVRSDSSTARRSQVTGHLLVVMPKVLKNNPVSKGLGSPIPKLHRSVDETAHRPLLEDFVDNPEVPPLE